LIGKGKSPLGGLQLKYTAVPIFDVRKYHTAMNEITIVEVAGQLVVDSRIIAEQLGIEHRSFIKLINKHVFKIEAKFGQVGFEIATVQNSAGAINEIKFAWLNEGQITALLTLCRNTERVVDLKFDLVEKFHEQKRQLENPVDRTLYNSLADRIAKLEVQPKPSLSLPRASVDPVPGEIAPMTERALCNRLVREYVFNQTTSQPLNEQDVWRWQYRELKYRHKYDINARFDETKHKTKLAQIEADGYLPQLLAICNHFLSN
jgi:phage regulator Rha-like protein